MSGKHYKGPEVSCCIKYFIFGFNVIFWFLGIAFLGIGLWAWNEKIDFLHVVENTVYVAPEFGILQLQPQEGDACCKS